jgi:hypothetical protein
MSLYLRTYGGGGGITSLFFTSTLDGCEWSASNPCRFTSRGQPRGTHFIGGWVGHGAGLDVVDKK